MDNQQDNELRISSYVSLLPTEIELTAIRAQGPGGQNVNKVSTAIHLRFDINKSSLPDAYKIKLLAMNDYRITSDGFIIIKAQKYRSQEQNRLDAIERLIHLIKKAMITHKKRTPTKPSKQSVKRRLDSKTKRGSIKKLRDKGSIGE